MVEVKFIVEIVIIIVAVAVVIFWLMSNYDSLITKQFFGYLDQQLKSFLKQPG